MKILVLENEPSSRRGGSEWCLLNTCAGLVEKGHDVDLVYAKDGDFIKHYQEFCASTTKVHRFRFDQKHLPSSAIDWCQSVISSLAISSDLIYVNHFNDSIFASTLARLKRLPLVCHLHVFPPKKFGGQCSIGLQSTTRFIAVSQVTRQAYVNAGFDLQEIEVVYNGIDLDRFSIKDDRSQTRRSLDIPSFAFVILYAGRIDPPKNIEMLLRAFACLELPSQQTRLLIAGNPVNHASQEDGKKYVQSLKDLCMNLGISENVHWLGSRADLPEIYRAADVTVLPSLLPDTFGLVLAESMACGTPALGLRFGGIPEVISDEFEHFQFGIGDINGLTRLLRSLNGWQKKDPTLGQRCREYITQRFPVSKSVSEIERIFQQVVESGPRRRGPSMKTVRDWNGEGVELCERTTSQDLTKLSRSKIHD